jgi:hypothetical protein
MLKNANTIIPDISGYTDFLTRTELEHSSHILSVRAMADFRKRGVGRATVTI